MGARNLTIVIDLEGNTKVAQYGQCDGYPSGVGLDVLRAIRNHDHIRILEEIDKCHMISEEVYHKMWTKAGHTGGDFVDMVVSNRFRDMYPTMHRYMSGGSLLDHIMSPDDNIVHFETDGDKYIGGYPVQDNTTFAADSLFCEWCYVVDFSNNTFEVYKGFNQTPLTEEDRFFYLEEHAEGGYHPVKLAASWPLDELPSEVDFILKLEPEEE